MSTPAPSPDSSALVAPPAVAAYAHFGEVPPAFRNALGQAATHGNFFATLRWFRYLAKSTLGHGQALKLYCITGAQASLLLPMVAQQADDGLGGLLKARCLNALANFYTPLFEPLASVVEPVMMTTLATNWAREKPRWDVIDLHPLDAKHGALAGLALACSRQGMAVQRYFCFGNWYLSVDGRSYQAIYADLPSRLRHTLERKSKQLGTRLRLEIVTGGAQLDATVATYETIYRSSWKGAEAFQDFMPGLMRLCARHGSLRLGIAYVDEQPAAAHFWIVTNGVASIYKLAYDQRFARGSVGSILMDRMMSHVIDIDRVREVDFLSGDDAYKKDWMPQRREREGLVMFNLRSWRGILLAVRHIGGRHSRQYVAKLSKLREFIRAGWIGSR